MPKYWNPRRIERIRQRKVRAQKKALQRAKALLEHQRSYTKGDADKNANLMLEALGLKLRRRMLSRLGMGGAMSLSKLAEPFRITLPTALQHLRMLERCGLVTTHKQGRIRICVYSTVTVEELADWLRSKKPPRFQ